MTATGELIVERYMAVQLKALLILKVDLRQEWPENLTFLADVRVVMPLLRLFTAAILAFRVGLVICIYKKAFAYH